MNGCDGLKAAGLPETELVVLRQVFDEAGGLRLKVFSRHAFSTACVAEHPHCQTGQLGWQNLIETTLSHSPFS